MIAAMPSLKDQLFKQIEARYQFVLPEAFRELWRRGFCTILGPGRPGPRYLMLPDMEWMPLEMIATFRFEPYHLPGLVPFAITAGGDYWCWQPEFTRESKTRVLCCYHDCYDADIYAPDCISAIYRRLLEGATVMQPDASAVETYRHEMVSAASAIAPFISSAWQQTLFRVADRALQTPRSPTSNATDFFLLSPRECGDILRRDLGWDRLDDRCRWMQPAG